MVVQPHQNTVCSEEIISRKQLIQIEIQCIQAYLHSALVKPHKTSLKESKLDQKQLPTKKNLPETRFPRLYLQQGCINLIKTETTIIAPVSFTLICSF